MRFYIVLALLSYLLALAFAAPATDYVMLSNSAYKDTAKVYTGSKASACINVDKAFKKSNTWIFTLGRSVDLYSGANCTKKFYTTKKSSRSTIAYQHSIMSFKVRN
ncbi:hypothetical protein GGH91_005811 [Coemansia sp. RSA 2671]|uniref:Uncharacterized protein n=1 Tax=Coemansia spiralis TaxID=417178 RepID=A0A9W8GJF6_9FUNG|nr:hypothetical protein LPJ60_005964 [Coemansia sp. RSA 2675]KAJ2333973.1 hypothetical protein GGH91_005811 [Coemansia sp. RSA 2671]KAJ2685102.1 hypothetical protein IWW39_004497 [Coemansia spiralis]